MAKISARQLDVRVSTLPTQFGEKIVMRLLDGSAGTKEFSALGFPEHIRRSLLSFGVAARHDSRDRAHRIGQELDTLRVHLRAAESPR